MVTYLVFRGAAQKGNKRERKFMEMVAAQVKFHTPRNRTIKAPRNQNKFLSTFACVWHCYCRLDVQASCVAVLCGVFVRFAARTFNALSRFVGCGGA